MYNLGLRLARGRPRGNYLRGIVIRLMRVGSPIWTS